MATIRRRRDKFQVRWWEKAGGKWKQRSVTCKTRRAAEKLKREIDYAIDLDGYWESRRAEGAPEPRQEPDLGEMTRVFLTAQKAGGKADNTILRYGTALDVFVRWMAMVFVGQRLVGSLLSESVITQFYVWLGEGTGRHGKERAATTRRKYVEVVINWWNWLASKDEWKQFVPGRVPLLRHLDMAPALRRRTRAPIWEEMDACIACARGWHQKLYIVLRFTGLRVQQAMGLQWTDIDLERLELHVRPELGKTPQERLGRWVPISKHLAAILAGWGRREGYVIETGRHEGAGDRSARLARSRDARRAWDRAVKEYGVRPEVVRQPHHCFRKGFNSELKRAGADPEAVESLQGRSLGTRGVYTDLDAVPMREAVDRIPPLSTPKRTRRVAHLWPDEGHKKVAEK